MEILKKSELESELNYIIPKHFKSFPSKPRWYDLNHSACRKTESKPFADQQIHVHGKRDPWESTWGYVLQNSIYGAVFGTRTRCQIEYIYFRFIS
jgi:hypothetical protein